MLKKIWLNKTVRITWLLGFWIMPFISLGVDRDILGAIYLTGIFLMVKFNN